MRLILASKSPRRRELLRLITDDFTVCAADIDESALSAPLPEALALRLAEAKAEPVFATQGGALPVIGCDTVVSLEDKTLGKPRNHDDAVAMLTALSGRRHRVLTGVCILHSGGAIRFTEATTVHFSPIPAGEIEAVAATDEPYDKAGGYGIQSWAARFIPRIEGCYYNAMGLPVSALWRALSGAGLL